MNGNIFSDKYVKEKLNRLEQINSQKRLKVQQATLSKKPQMSRHDYEKYKKILFDQSKKSTQTTEEKTNDTIPTKDLPTNSQQGVKVTQTQQNSEIIKMNKSLDRNRSPKAGEIVFKAPKRSCSKTQKGSLNHSEILHKSPLQQQSPKQGPIPYMNNSSNNNQQKLKQSKSLMKLSNTMKQNDMSESQLTQEIPNSSRTQHVLQNMKSILSIASPHAYFSNATSMIEDPNQFELTQQQNPLQRFNQFNQKQQQQYSQIQYTPQPLSPGNNQIMPIIIQQNENQIQGLYPTYQTQQSIDFMNTDNPEFAQMIRNQNNQNRFMKNSQMSNFNEEMNQHNTSQNYNNYQQYQQQDYQNTNNPNFYLSPKSQTQPHFLKAYQPQQQAEYNTFDQNPQKQSDFYNQSQQLEQVRTNNFQRQLHTEDNLGNEQSNLPQNFYQNGIVRRQISHPEINSSIYSQPKQQYYQEQQLNDRQYQMNQNFDSNNYPSDVQNKQYQNYQRNSQIEFNEGDQQEEQQYLQHLSYLGVQEDLNESEALIYQLKQNQSVLKQEKEQLERELADLESQTKNIKHIHKRQQSSFNDTTSLSLKTNYLEASFKKQAPIQEHFQQEQEDFYTLGFQQKWEMLEREEEETERSFMMISEYLNIQSEQSRQRIQSRQHNTYKEENISKGNVSSHSINRKKSEEYEKKSHRKNSDQITESGQVNYQNKEEEDMEWLDGIEESFCELKSINKNELMPYYTEIQSKKKSYLDKYPQSGATSHHEQTAVEDDAYIRLKNQIIADQAKQNQRGGSLKVSNHFNDNHHQETSSLSKKEILQESAKGTRSPQFGSSGRIQGFSYLNEQSGRESIDHILKKEANFFKQRIGTSPSSSQGMNLSNADNYQIMRQDFKKDNSFQSTLLSKDDPLQKSNSCNNLIQNFYSDINEISKKNSEKFIKQDYTLVQTDRSLQKSNEILGKINQKYPNSKLSLSKSGGERMQIEQTQQKLSEDINDEDIRQQQYIMRKLNEMQAENNSQASSMREKELQYSQTISSYLAQADSQFKRSSSPLFNNLNNNNNNNDVQSNKDRQSFANGKQQENTHKLFNKRIEQQQIGSDHINEELQVADLNNYSSFRNELQQSEQQHQEYYEDQYFKLSNNKNSSFEKELQQIHASEDNNKNPIHQEAQQQPQKKNLFSSLMQNVQQELNNISNVSKGTSQQANNSSNTSLFQKKLESRMEQFYQQQNEQSDQKNEDKPRKMSQEKQQQSNIQSQINKVFSKAAPSDDDDSDSSGDELEETILQKLQKLKKKRNSSQREKSPLSQNVKITSDLKNKTLTSSKRESQDSISSNEQINKENNNNNLQSNLIYKNSLSSSTSSEQSGAKLKFDELFNKHKLKDSQLQQQQQQQQQQLQLEAHSLTSSKSSSTRDKISSIQQKLNTIFEKKNVQSPQSHQENVEENISNKFNTDNYDYPKKQMQNKNTKDIRSAPQQESEPRIDRQVIDNLAEEVEMLMKMQNIEMQYKEKDNENKQLRQEYLKHERHIYGEDGDIINLQGDYDEEYNQYNNQSESQKNFFKAKQQLPLYEIEEEHSVDNSIVDQNFQIKNQYY